VVISAYAAASYLDLRRVAVANEESRLLGVSELLARLSGQAMSGRLAGLQRLGADAALARAATSLDTANGAIPARLAEHARSDARILSIEVRARNGTCRWSAWRSSDGGAVQTAPGCPAGIPAPAAQADTATVFPFGEHEGALHYTLAVPIGGGQLVEHRRAADEPAAALIASLIAPDAELVFGNRDQSLGTSVVESIPSGMSGAPSVASVFDTGAGPRFGVSAPIRGTPLVIWVHRDMSAVFAPVRQAMVGRIWLALSVLLLGSLGAVLMSRRLTGPLAEITEAADALRHGDWSRRVELERNDEFGRLAEAFNDMAGTLESTHAELGQRVDERTAELQEALDRLAEAQEALVKRERLAVLGQLAGGVGHELRSPLGVMTNAVYYLRAVLTELPGRSADYLDILDRQIETSKKIISDLLDYARVRPAQREPTALSGVVTDVLAIAPRSGKMTVLRELAPDLPRALVDGDQVRQILLNLVTNALQAVAETPDPRVIIRAAPAEGGRVVIDVEDNGPGVPTEDRQRVFEPLFSTKPKGIGLGLAVSRSLAIANGGDLEVEPRPGGGARFRLGLPAAQAAMSRATQLPRMSAELMEGRS
jgi:signal transduction histidine kinase